ncbi:hypothetical protein HG530_014093 [Fusarium avenaceum]|nr:hypothetical protein HG530_014093 [Fusarium avenaceum]
MPPVCIATVTLLPTILKTSLHHGADNLVDNLGSSQGSLLAAILVGGRHLDNISADEVQALDTTENADELACGPTAGLRGASAGGEGRVEDVDVDGEIHGVLCAEDFEDAVDDTLCADVVDVVGGEADPALRCVVLVVGEVVAGETSAQTSVDGAFRGGVGE